MNGADAIATISDLDGIDTLTRGVGRGDPHRVGDPGRAPICLAAPLSLDH